MWLGDAPFEDVSREGAALSFVTDQWVKRAACGCVYGKNGRTHALRATVLAWFLGQPDPALPASDLLFACRFCRKAAIVAGVLWRVGTAAFARLKILNGDERRPAVPAVGSLLFLSSDAFWLADLVFACCFCRKTTFTGSMLWLVDPALASSTNTRDGAARQAADAAVGSLLYLRLAAFG